MIDVLFPPSVVVIEATPAMWDAPLRPAEAWAVRNAVPGRRREFAAGRACARAALGRLGLHDASMPVGETREPRWPDGMIGSISHCRNRCIVAVARRGDWIGLGLDLERVEPLEGTEISLVGSPAELEAAGRSTGLPEAVAAKVLFSVKEAVYKACFPVLGERWDFFDVGVRLGAGTYVAAAPALMVSGRYVLDDGWIFAGATLPAQALAARSDSSALR
jgi:4'-phosphopantetheinyl transferase EntD